MTSQCVNVCGLCWIDKKKMYLDV